MPHPNLLVLSAYLLLTVALGLYFAFRKRDTDQFMAGGRSLPGWAVGLSMFGSYISSISYLANPGSAFKGNWNGFVFSLATPFAAAVAILFFVPFYRRAGHVSAYEHLEHRFGPWARTYAVACFLLVQMARTGTILFLLALALNSMLGWDVRLVITAAGAGMVLYTVFGGIQAAVWIGVVQSLVLLAGPVVCMTYILKLVPGGLPEVLSTARAAGKFSPGSLSPSLSAPTLWVTFVYGLAIHLSNFSVDQSYVQRYITTPTDREARHSVLITTLLYVPVAGFFFFIGTALFVLHAARPELFAGVNAADADTVFPHFIAHVLPAGLGGLVIAGIFAAAMDSTLSSMATLTLCDLYQKYVDPDVSQRSAMRILSLSVIAWGALSVAVAIAMTRVRGVLEVWWDMAGVFNGGVLGLFLLGLLTRARNPAAATGLAVGVLLILWMTFSPWLPAAGPLAHLRSPFHKWLIPVIGTLAIFLAGLLCQKLFGRDHPTPTEAS